MKRFAKFNPASKRYELTKNRKGAIEQYWSESLKRWVTIPE